MVPSKWQLCPAPETLETSAAIDRSPQASKNGALIKVCLVRTADMQMLQKRRFLQRFFAPCDFSVLVVAKLYCKKIGEFFKCPQDILQFYEGITPQGAHPKQAPSYPNTGSPL
jgi:hypothetical protein